MEFIEAKTILSGYSEQNSWFGNNYNMNIYKGCCHGCIYCDSRSECYHVEDFDRVRAKENALALIGSELRAKRRKGVVGTGAMSDPYNPFEKEHELTRGALKLINQYGFGISIATKSSLVTRDIDLLTEIARHSPVLVKLTVTAASDSLSSQIEPGASRSSERFQAIKELTDAGIFAGILMMPILPFIEDTEENIQGILEMAGESGAKFVYPALGVTLRQNQRDWYYQKLDGLFPGMSAKYRETFGNSYECSSPRAIELGRLIREKCIEYGMLYKMRDIITEYKRPYQIDQLSLFD